MESFPIDHLPVCENTRKYVQRELSHSPLKDENILVNAEGNDIILQGDVDSLDKKWMAEDIARDTFGVLHVKNEISVSNDIEKENFYED